MASRSPRPSVSLTKGHAPRTLLRCRQFRWRGVPIERYKRGASSTWAGIDRQVLFAGSRGAKIGFDVRYFEIEPGGYSSLEMHDHAHVIVALRGRGKIRIGRRSYALAHLDACYIGPRTAHQLQNGGREPFGFLCLVDAQRDRGVPVLAEKAAHPAATRA